MFRKATIAAAALIALTGTLTGCATTTYTGTAIVKTHEQAGKNCLANLELPNKEISEFHMGLRDTCDSITDGATVTMKDGYYQK